MYRAVGTLKAQFLAGIEAKPTPEFSDDPVICTSYDLKGQFSPGI